MSKECQLEANKAQCSCPDKTCSNRGACCQCVAYHRNAGDLPWCLRKNR